MTAAVDRGEWPQFMKEFTRRNAGRLTRLELDDRELGVQWGELDLHFRGAAYEPRYRRVELMLSNGGGPTDHLTHSVEGVTHLYLQRDDAGADQALSIGYAGGQTVLFLGAPD